MDSQDAYTAYTAYTVNVHTERHDVPCRHCCGWWVPCTHAGETIDSVLDGVPVGCVVDRTGAVAVASPFIPFIVPMRFEQWMAYHLHIVLHQRATLIETVLRGPVS